MVRQVQDNVSQSLKAYADLLLKLHQQIAVGRGEMEESNSLRDHMDVYWKDLDESELAIVRQLSADLYTIYDGTNSRHPRGIDLYSSALAVEMAKAHQSKNFVRVLQLLGERSNEISFDRATIIRGMSYRELGLVDAGLDFIWHAASESRNPDSAYIIALHTLWHYVDIDAAVTRALGLLREGKVAGIELKFLVACIFLKASANKDGSFRKEYAEVSKKIFQELLQSAPPGEAMAAQAKCHELLSHCFYLLGETPRAIEELGAAIAANPNDHELYVQRGLMQLDSDFWSAKSDFESAARLATASVWPYYYLSFDAFRSKDFDRCVRIATIGMSRTSDLDIQARLHEFIAMSIASGGSSLSPSTIEAVRHHFRTGMILSPANQQILANSQVFEDALQSAILQHNWILRPPVTSERATTIALNERFPELVPSG
jgi:tetratricopeptide (TPR) repeat protein